MDQKNSIVTLKTELSKSTSKKLNQLTPVSIIENELPTLFDIKKLGQEEKLVDVVQIMLINLAENVNVGNNLTSDQIQRLSMDIVIMYETMTAEDIYLVFQRISHGLYGTLYNSLSPNYIHEAIRKYGEEKDRAIQEVAARKQGINPIELSKSLTPKDKERVDDLINRIIRGLDVRRYEKRMAKFSDVEPIKSLPSEKFIQNVIHYHFLCEYKIDRVTRIIGQRTEDIEAAIEILKDYVIKNEYNEVSRVLYDDITSEMKRNDSRLRKLIDRLFS